MSAIPGAALTVASVALLVAYNVCKPFRAKVDKELDHHLQGLEKAVGTAEKVAKPVFNAAQW